MILFAGVYALSYALQHQQVRTRTARYSIASVSDTPDTLASASPPAAASAAADRVVELSLELLIHEIVEEEATTRLPVPGALRLHTQYCTHNVLVFATFYSSIVICLKEFDLQVVHIDTAVISFPLLSGSVNCDAILFAPVI